MKINNAGSIPRGNILETIDEIWFAALNINLTAVFYLCRAAIPHMKSRGGGAMRLTVRISNTLLQVVEGLSPETVVEKTVPLTIGQLATELKIPTLLIAIAVADGVKRPLDFRLTQNTEIALIGPIAGG